MSEAVVVNLATVLRTLILGGAMLIIPRITRKGLLFGAYVGERFADGDQARSLLRRWDRSTLAVAFFALAVGLAISVAGHPLAGNLTCTGILIVGGIGLYIKFYREAKRLVPPEAQLQAKTAVAFLEVGKPRGESFAKFAIVICLIAGLASVIYAVLNYGALPDRIPTGFGPSGRPDSWFDRSFGSVFLAPTLNLVLGPFFALLGLLTARAKISLRGGRGGRSAEAQVAFRAAFASLLSITALFTSALMTYISVELIRIGLSQSHFRWVGFLVIAVSMIVFLFGGLIWVFARFGQGGSRLEEGSPDAPLTNGLADNSNWYLGVFYVNRVDPSIMVEKRFGWGYTMNFGNPKAVLIVVSFLVVTLGLVAVAFLN